MAFKKFPKVFLEYNVKSTSTTYYFAESNLFYTDLFY